ncbi:SDR family oxidoreductase [Hamadaea sp. NPDC051192]|uniref:SDR family oxidoreductase n=1 Tax=Hamadaea sp. NPDC051192 TaxID=3154940 RepID=UPI00342D7718
MTDRRHVLVVGATGSLGGQVVDQLLARGKQVRALVRPGSDAGRLETLGVEIARGDMLDPASLDRAMTDADAVVTTAAGYTRRIKNATEIDTVGNANLAEAAARTGVRRFVLTSILTSDQTPGVPHFWHKKLAEDRLEQLAVPFVALRPGAFLDQVTQFGGDPFAKGRLMWLGDARVPLTFVLTADLARYLAAAVDAAGVDGQRIDIGWDRPASMTDLAQLATRLLGKQIRVRSIPTGLIHAMGTVFGPFVPMVKDMSAMVDWFGTGRYVADTTRQAEVFGAVPTAEDAVARFARRLGHPVR